MFKNQKIASIWLKNAYNNLQTIQEFFLEINPKGYTRMALGKNNVFLLLKRPSKITGFSDFSYYLFTKTPKILLVKRKWRFFLRKKSLLKLPVPMNSHLLMTDLII